jgi:formate hydrogenlyase subunit 3/multisubunit Na+/H+ antiporter MnhD subunit
MTTLLFVLTPFLPLTLALAMVPAAWRRRVAALLPLAPLPALALAVAAEPGDAVALPYVLLGIGFGVDAVRLPFLLLSALLWTAAAVYSRGYFAGDRQSGRFEAIFLVTMAGNLGLVVAQDAATFYVFFSLMTLSSYILVVHERTPFAYYAGQVYIVLALVGETLLLIGLLRAASAAGSVLIPDIAVVLADEAAHGATLLLLFAGFAIKAGLVPLHVWLPLAHPAAPTPASAVLSGAIVKAGLLGMMVLLPVGEAALPALGWLLAGVGMATAFYGVLAGIPQANPKTVLAYSSLSQMGLMVAALGAILAAPAAAPALLPAIAIYAVHHGLAKGALFFAVGVVQARARGRQAALLIAAIAALAIAGLPLTAGALAKALLKYPLEDSGGEAAAAVAALLPWSAMATTLLMARFLHVLSRGEVHGGRPLPRIEALLWAPFALTAAASQLLPWAIVVADPELSAGPALAAAALWEGTWPMLLAAALAVLALAAQRREPRWRLPRVPEGDLVALMPSGEALAAGWSRTYDRTLGALRWPRRMPSELAAGIGPWLTRTERAMERAQGGAALALLLVAVLLVYGLL